MTAPLSDHLLKVTDLLERPGASREVQLGMPVPDDFELPLASVDAPVRLEGVVESVVDGLLVRGRLSARLGLACGRCLRPAGGDAGTQVTELFMDPSDVEPDDEVEEGYEIQDGHIDLDALLRDGLAAAIPYRPLCREDCRGLCAECGTNLNEAQCGCADAVVDPRWEALRGLRLPDDRR